MSLAPDTLISQAEALAYWSTVSPDTNGMLGGYPQISAIDLKGSAGFLTKLRRRAMLSSTHPKITSPPDSPASQDFSASLPPLDLVVDCGAGIGRITLGFLSNVAQKIDIVEPVKKFTDEITSGPTFQPLRDQSKLGHVYTVGLEDWRPAPGVEYDVIWHQWCCGQLNDDQLARSLRTCAGFLKTYGWIVVKENVTSDPEGKGEDVYDDTDSSVTRAEHKFRAIFKTAGLKVVMTELQRGFPRSLFPVRMYALQPTDWK